MINIQKTHDSILKEGTKEELWEHIQINTEEGRRQRVKEEQHTEDIGIKTKHDDFIKSGGYKLSPQEVLSLCAFKAASKVPFSTLDPFRPDGSLTKILIDKGYLEKKFLSKPAITIKGQQISDYSSLILGFIGRSMPDDELKKFMKSKGFNEKEILYNLSLMEVYKKRASG